MPELPELQAHAERLSATLAGHTLVAFEPLSFSVLHTVSPTADAPVGRTLAGVRRRGKYLLLDLGECTYVAHLMQGGRLRVDERRSRRPRGGRARWTFRADEGGETALLLTEAGTERRAGVWVIAGDALSLAPLGELGPEADSVDAAQLADLLDAHSMRLHTFLREQRILAGLGRRLANEVCHRARLSPFALTGTLDHADAARIVGAVRDAVAHSLHAERTRSDMSAAAQRPARVHGRAGQPCPVCGDTVRTVEYRAYTVYYCPTCQTAGRALADNVTSKFLK